MDVPCLHFYGRPLFTIRERPDPGEVKEINNLIVPDPTYVLWEKKTGVHSH